MRATWTPSAAGAAALGCALLLGAGCGSPELVPAAAAVALPNLTVLADRMNPSTRWDTFAADSCEAQEACIGAPGTRRLLTFDAVFPNVGEADLVFGDPAGNPAFELSPCHGHYHLHGFSEYELLDQAGRVVVAGHKQSYCVRDDEALPGTTTPGDHDCQNQGLSRGWADVYDASLPCQWIDVTDVPPGAYVLRVRLNPDHVFAESRYDDDVASVPVEIAPP
jgi:hypothetical protein